ncbi:MAG TPA: carboxylating nicotinate-nucleotide diphosphorylase [bacterium]|nr:carboxylating nicotinate-nucleotide diphosphorylase [bacterium]
MMTPQIVQTGPDAQEIEAIVRRALDEDLGAGDVTTDSIVPADAVSRGQFLAKAAGVVAGWEVVAATFAALDPRVVVRPAAADGEAVEAGSVIGTVAGPVRALLSGERVALNFLQRLSGIATTTRAFVRAVEGTRAVILDTRKTAPGLRRLDRLAVRLGGGTNHRLGLFDMALIKENHIAVAGGIAAAVRRVRAALTAAVDRAGDPDGAGSQGGAGRRVLIEVEVRTLAELREALDLVPDRILLDNMSPAEMGDAVRIAAGRVPLEASGGVRLETAAEIARTGVDYISVGALTHSVKALDISLELAGPPVPGKTPQR